MEAQQEILIADGKKVLKALYTNCDSLSNKKSELETLIEQKKPDIVGLTEILPKFTENEQDLNDYDILNYDLFTPSLSKGRGVALYVHKHHKACLIEELSYDVFQESVWCKIVVQNKEKLLVGCVYRSPSSSLSNNERLRTLLNRSVDKKYEYLIIVGDFNYKEIDWSLMSSKVGFEHPATVFLEGFKDMYLFQHVQSNTRFRNDQQPSLLDLVISNEENLVDNLVVGAPIGKSDHATIFFEICCQYTGEVAHEERYNLHKGEYDALRSFLSNQTLTDEYISCEDNWQLLKNIIDEGMNRFIPKRTKKDSKKTPWLNRDALDAIENKQRMWKKYQNCRSPASYQRYTRSRNKATYSVRKAKRNFERKIALDIKNDPKSFWNYVRSKTKVKTAVGNLLKPDGSMTNNEAEKAEVLNIFFCISLHH